MLAKHVDVIALFVIALGLLAFKGASAVRVPDVSAADFRIKNAVLHSARPVVHSCPILDALTLRFR